MLDEAILNRINTILADQLVNPNPENQFNRLFHDYVAEFTLRGGKRIRPALIYFTYQIFANVELETVLKLSTFIEHIQAWLLMHDDIMDHDKLRRGKPTVHTEFETIAADYNFDDAKDFGNTFGILAGDYAAMLAFEVLADSPLEAAKLKKILLWVSRELKNVIFGQNLDIITSHNPDYELRDLINIAELKTARYTFTIPCIAGGILGGAENEDMKALEAYSKYIGIAFQIRDDILGVFGEEDVTGKSNNGDIQEGKKTILIWKAMEQANDEQKILLNTMLGKEDLTEAQADQVRKVIQDTGALDFAEDECCQYVSQAKEHLAKLPNQEGEGWKFLEWIADYMLVRKK